MVGFRLHLIHPSPNPSLWLQSQTSFSLSLSFLYDTNKIRIVFVPVTRTLKYINPYTIKGTSFGRASLQKKARGARSKVHLAVLAIHRLYSLLRLRLMWVRCVCLFTISHQFFFFFLHDGWKRLVSNRTDFGDGGSQF